MKALLFHLGLILLYPWAFAAPQPLNPPDKITIQWLIHDLPPVLVLNSDDLVVNLDKAEGPAATMYKILKDSLPQYHHRYLRIPFVRAEKILKEKKQFCTLLLQENKARSDFLIFGEEVAVIIPSGLILKSASQNKNNHEDGRISLKKTLTPGNFRLGIVKGRYYSPGLESILAQNKKSFNFVSDGSAGNLLAMVSTGRLDGVLGYYFEMTDYEQRHSNSPELQFLRIKEAPEFITIRASCEKTPWGEKTLKAISKVIKEKHFKDLAHQYLMSVLPPERRKEYQKIYESRPTSPE